MLHDMLHLLSSFLPNSKGWVLDFRWIYTDLKQLETEWKFAVVLSKSTKYRRKT